VLSFTEQLESASHRLLGALARAQALRSDPACEAVREALAFNLERAAWATIELAQAWVFELRLGIPRKETESFDLLQRHGWLELDRARRFKQLCEFRALSQRDPRRTDWDYLGGDLSAELALFADWERQTRGWQMERPRV
jgi:hypothetical protein